MQRALDILISALLLIICLPICLIVVVVLRLTGEGEVFYTQNRIGIHKNKFKILKFATMLKDSGNMPGGDITSKNDCRILPLGKFLRISKINELPQLYNVLKGDMSIVGPRPLTANNFEMYSEESKEILSKTRPGITSVAALYFRNEEVLISDTADRSVEEIYRTEIVPYKEILELWYMNNIGLKCYFKILLATFIIVISRNTKLLRYFFDDLPHAPDNLVNLLEMKDLDYD